MSGIDDGHFKIIEKRRLDDMNIGDTIPESDFATITPEGTFVQMEYISEDDGEIPKFDVKPGIFVIRKSMSGLYVETASFVDDSILET